MEHSQPRPGPLPNAALAEKVEALERKLDAANAQIRRYETRLFAYERAMQALRKENDRLEALCDRLCSDEDTADDSEPEVSVLEMPDPQFEPPTLPPREAAFPAAPSCPDTGDKDDGASPAPSPAGSSDPPAEDDLRQEEAAAEPAAPPLPKQQTTLSRLSEALLDRMDRLMEQ